MAEGCQKLLGVQRRAGRDEAAGGGEGAYEGVGREAVGAERRETSVAVALGEATTVGADDKGDVDEARRHKTECTIEKKLVVRGIEEVVATQDFGNPHGGIVHDNGEGVPCPVGRAGEHKV